MLFRNNFTKPVSNYKFIVKLNTFAFRIQARPRHKNANNDTT